MQIQIWRKDFWALLKPTYVETIRVFIEPGLIAIEPDSRFLFERHGYFVADRVDSVMGKPVFNRATTLKDGWAQ